MEASQSLHLPLLIIPIIMAHCENLINNTEDIVVAISHMVVGLCSVTTLPLASTYVCQKHAAMTSSSSAHLTLPPSLPSRPPLRKGEGGGEGGGGRAIPPGILPERFPRTPHPIRSERRDKMSASVWDGQSRGGGGANAPGNIGRWGR